MAPRRAATLILVAFLALVAARTAHAGASAQPQRPACAGWLAIRRRAGEGAGLARDRSAPRPGTSASSRRSPSSRSSASSARASRSRYVTLAASVLYLGFVKSQLISVVNIFALVEWNLPIFKYSLAWYLLAVFTVASTVLWGRLYCGRICAFGSLTQLMDSVVPAKLRVRRAARDRAPGVVHQVRHPWRRDRSTSSSRAIG